jgi:hypothetical protein
LDWYGRQNATVTFRRGFRELEDTISAFDGGWEKSFAQQVMERVRGKGTRRMTSLAQGADEMAHQGKDPRDRDRV